MIWNKFNAKGVLIIIHEYINEYMHRDVYDSSVARRRWRFASSHATYQAYADSVIM